MKIVGVGMSELFIVFVIPIVMLVAWLLAINLLIKVGEAKGHALSNKGLLWFIGIFATPIVVGLYIIALPDRRAEAARKAPPASAATDELPEL